MSAAETYSQFPEQSLERVGPTLDLFDCAPTVEVVGFDVRDPERISKKKSPERLFATVLLPALMQRQIAQYPDGNLARILGESMVSKAQSANGFCAFRDEVLTTHNTAQRLAAMTEGLVSIGAGQSNALQSRLVLGPTGSLFSGAVPFLDALALHGDENTQDWVRKMYASLTHVEDLWHPPQQPRLQIVR